MVGLARRPSEARTLRGSLHRRLLDLVEAELAVLAGLEVDAVEQRDLPSNLEVFVKLKPMSEWRSNIHTLDDIVDIMDKNLKAIPGLEYNFSQPIRDNVAENISGQFGQVAVKI